MKNEKKELELNEMEQASGGILPYIIIGVGALAGYCIYKGIKKGKESNWK